MSSELEAVQHELSQAREKLALIEERMGQYVLSVDIPLQLVKEKRELEKHVGQLEQRLPGLRTAGLAEPKIRLGKYPIVAQLGQGGMAEVYKAYHPGLERHVAIKVMHSHLVGDDESIHRFKREATAVAHLRHPNIVQVHDFDVEGDRYYMVMEFVEGSTLKDELKKRRSQGQAFTLAEISRIFNSLAEAIDYAHARGMIHRDLKPGNIMFTAEGQPVVADFGVVRMLKDTAVTLNGEILGTPAYMSPEQGLGEGGDTRSDIYSLGVILYEMVTGRAPFDAGTPFAVIMKQINDPPPLPGEVNPQVPKAVEQVICKALSKNPDERYQTAREMARALREAVGEEGESKRPAPFQVPPDVPWFVGREGKIAEFCERLAHPTQRRIYCLTGMGGIGKSALATHMAHRLRSHFTDGVLWANAATSEPLAILDSWAKQYGYDLSGQPDLDSRAAALRGLLADKKVLVVLDDVVGSAARVRPLLPAGEECVALLTTRDLQVAAALNAYTWRLAGLAPTESRQLLTYIVGDERVMAEADCADEICRLLANLPLAIEIAAQRLNTLRGWRLADLAERLRDQKSRLNELKISDREVRASFAVSWEALDKALRRSFALLAVFQGRACDGPALSAVGEMDRRAAEDALGALAALSLVSEEGETRHYRQHPLLADFAAEHLGQDEAAYARMVRYYREYAAKHRHDYAALMQEWDNLLVSMRMAYERHIWQVVIAFSKALAGAWFAWGHFSDARQGYAWAGEAAQALKSPQSWALSLCQWGRACIEQGDYSEAEQHLSHSLSLYRELADQGGIASALYYLGRVAIEKADFDRAQPLLAESRRIRQQLGDVSGVAETLYIEADIPYCKGDYAEAERLGKQALAMQQSNGDKLGCVRSLGLLADIALEQNDPGLAQQYCRQALDICEVIQERDELGAICYILAEALRRCGDLRTARECAEKSLALFTQHGNRRAQAIVLRRLGAIDADLKDYDLALQEGLRSLDLLRELGGTWTTIYTLLHVGDVYQALNRLDQAQEMWSEGLSLAEATPPHPLTATLRQRLGAKP